MVRFITTLQVTDHTNGEKSPKKVLVVSYPTVKLIEYLHFLKRVSADVMNPTVFPAGALVVVATLRSVDGLSPSCLSFLFRPTDGGLPMAEGILLAFCVDLAGLAVVTC